MYRPHSFLLFNYTAWLGEESKKNNKKHELEADERQLSRTPAKTRLRLQAAALNETKAETKRQREANLPPEAGTHKLNNTYSSWEPSFRHFCLFPPWTPVWFPTFHWRCASAGSLSCRLNVFAGDPWRRLGKRPHREGAPSEPKPVWVCILKETSYLPDTNGQRAQPAPTHSRSSESTLPCRHACFLAFIKNYSHDESSEKVFPSLMWHWPKHIKQYIKHINTE